MLVIIKYIPIVLLRYYINTQSFVHNKSSSVTQFISSKSRNLQKLLRYLSGIVTSTFKVGTAGRFVSSSFRDHSGVFPTIFVLYLYDLSSEALLLILSISSL